MGDGVGVLVFIWLFLVAAGVHSTVPEKESGIEKVSCVGVGLGVGGCGWVGGGMSMLVFIWLFLVVAGVHSTVSEKESGIEKVSL